MEVSHRVATPAGPGLAIRYGVHIVLALAVAALVWHHRLPWLLDAQDVQRYLVLGFVLMSALVLVLAVPLELRVVSRLLGLDLLGWLGLPGAIVATHIAPLWYGGWLTCALALKLVPPLWALFSRVRSGLGDRLSGLVLSTVFLVSSLLMLPYTRFRVSGSPAITGDEPHYLTVTANLLQGGGFWVGKAYTNGTFARLFGSAIPFSQWRLHTGRTVTGHFGPGHDLGVSLLAVPFFAAAGTKGVLIAMAFVAALTVYEIYLLLRAMKVARETAVVVTVLSVFSLPFLPFATQIFAETPMACCAAIVARRLFVGKDSRVDVVVVSIALAAMPWLHVRAWPIALCLLVGALVTWRSVFARACLVGVLAVSAAGYWFLLYTIYGKFVLTPVTLQPGIHPDLSRMGITQIVAGLEALFVDPVSGLLPSAPIWLLSLGGLFLLAWRSIAGAATAAAVVLYALFVGGSTVMGTGPGTALPGRFAVTLVPLLAPGLALAWERLRGAWWSELRWPLVAWTAVCAFAVQAVRPFAYPPGMVVRLAGFFGEPIPSLGTGAMPWILLSVLIVLLGAVLLGIFVHPLRGPTPDTRG